MYDGLRLVHSHTGQCKSTGGSYLGGGGYLFSCSPEIILREKGEKRQYWGTSNMRKLRLGEQGNKPNYFRETREQVPSPPPPKGSVEPKRQILGVIRAKSDGPDESAHLSLA